MPNLIKKSVTDSTGNVCYAENCTTLLRLVRFSA
jgi:hypothetical protein